MCNKVVVKIEINSKLTEMNTYCRAIRASFSDIGSYSKKGFNTGAYFFINDEGGSMDGSV